MRNTTKFLAPAALAMTLLAMAPAANATPAEALRCTQTMVNTADDQGFRLRSWDSDSMAQGFYADYDVTLQRGVGYLIFACGDSRAHDIDIYLYDEDGNLVDRDNQTDNHPVVTVRPRHTGAFRVRIKMYSSYGAANYTMAIMYQ
jgi:hypothetical protein